jgi:hypothetical protein
MAKVSWPVKGASVAPALLTCLGVLSFSVLWPAAGLALDWGFRGLSDSLSPLVFPPAIRAEARVTPIWVSIVSGKLTVPPDTTLSLREQFALNSGHVFLDSMGRLQAGSFSVRVHYEPRSFVGKVRSAPDTGISSEARFDFSGARVGGDVDIFQRNLSRVGFNIDYYIYSPIFTQSIRPQLANELIGQEPVTIGFHAIYNPLNNLYGLSGIAEARARWSVGGTTVQDLELAAGVKAPETILGNVALRAGYRRTALEYIDARHTIDAVIAGWFGEVAYYY